MMTIFSSFSPLCMWDETPVNKTTLNFCHYFSLSLYTKKNNRGKKKKVKRARSRLLFSFFFLGNSFLYLSSLWKSSFDDQELGIAIPKLCKHLLCANESPNYVQTQNVNCFFEWMNELFISIWNTNGSSVKIFSDFSKNKVLT